MSIREAYKSKWICALTGMVVGAGLLGGLSYRQHRAQLMEASQAEGAYCGNGVGAARVRMGSAASAITQTAWIPRINDGQPPRPAPAGMIWVPGGQFWMGPMTTTCRIQSRGAACTSTGTGWTRPKLPTNSSPSIAPATSRGAAARASPTPEQVILGFALWPTGNNTIRRQLLLGVAELD